MKLKLITSSMVLAISLAANLYAQEKVDPFRKGGVEKSDAVRPPAVKSTGNRLNNVDKHIPDTYTVIYEVFSMPMKEASELMRSGKNDTEVYQYLIQKAKQEWLAVLRNRSGERSTSESVSEIIYPTEFDSPTLPGTLGVQITPVDSEGDEQQKNPQLEKLSQAPRAKDLSGLATPALPTAFETRNAGVTVEFELTVNKQSGTCDMRINPEHVTLSGQSSSGQGVSKTEMPEFEAQRLMTAVTCPLKKPVLLGTMNRSPFSKHGLPDRVWFAMVTVKPVLP